MLTKKLANIKYKGNTNTNFTKELDQAISNLAYVNIFLESHNKKRENTNFSLWSFIINFYKSARVCVEGEHCLRRASFPKC